ncbi:hypothetical protein ACFY4I_10340 [Streptomyces scabiei]|uniref:hypothetical protein n=1 Tax=Streptomyces scabiei TaxID=1930 RepID=UPI003692CFD1
MPPTARIAEFPKTAAEQACWWERHILEVLDGLPPDAPAGTVPRPDFDPERNSLAQRERAKAAELTAAGHAMTGSGVKQRRQRYQRDGLVGLADGRAAKQMPSFGRGPGGGRCDAAGDRRDGRSIVEDDRLRGLAGDTDPGRPRGRGEHRGSLSAHALPALRQAGRGHSRDGLGDHAPFGERASGRTVRGGAGLRAG